MDFRLPRPLPEPAVERLTVEFGKDLGVSDASLTIVVEVEAMGQGAAVSEGLTHVFATLDEAELTEVHYWLEDVSANEALD